MKRIMSIALVLILALSIFGCGSEDEDTGESQGKTEVSQGDTQEDIKTPQAPTPAEELSMLLKEKGYTEMKESVGMDALAALVSQINMSGAIFTEEWVEQLYSGVCEYYCFEKEQETVVFARMSESGMKNFCCMISGKDPSNALIEAKELGWAYGDCAMITKNPDLDGIIKDLRAVEDTK